MTVLPQIDNLLPGIFPRRRLLFALPILLALSAAVTGGTIEEEEAARIQIGGANIPNAETLRIFPVAEVKPVISSWLGCKVEAQAETLTVSPAAGVKPWAGFTIRAPKGVKPLELTDVKHLDAASLVFKIKARGKAELKNLQVCVAGTAADGKPVQSGWFQLRRIAFAADKWIEVSLNLKDFAHADQLKNVNGAGFQFVGQGPGDAFELDSIRLLKKVSKTVQTVFSIDNPDLGNLKLSTEKFPVRATNIRISGGDIVRDGKPVFLTGVEDDAIDFPWLYRLLGFDIIQLQDFATANQLRWKQDGNRIKVTWDPMKDWIDTKIRLLLSRGFAVHINYWDNVPNAPAFRECFADALAETSHFYEIRLDHPLGRELREKYLKASLKTLGRYPITFYELYNEIYYGDTGPLAVEAFQKAMKTKYGTVAAANRAWSTSFRSFEMLVPPRKKAKWMVTQNEISPPDASPELYAEWQEFIEQRLGTQLRRLTAEIRKELKYPGSYLIYQATMGLHQDFSGFTGTDPYELLSAEDALCHEGGMHFRPQKKGAENSTEIAGMTRPLMIWDLLKNISPDKPVYLSECGIGSYAPNFDPKSTVIGLAGSWRFADDSKGRGLTLGFQKPEFDDRAWGRIAAPGVWGKQGFPQCTSGWLRRRFDLPARDSGRLFLTGKELADTAKIYVNGKLVHETSSWNEGFSVDITDLVKPQGNVLALCIDNKYEVGGQMQGGIRDFLAVTDRQFFKAPKVTAGQMRSWFWSMAVHDVSGVIMSYFYTPATNKDVSSIYSPETREYEAIRAIPEAKREIDAVAETLLPRPRLRGKTAFVYPFESGRARIPANTTDMFTGKITLAMMEYYLAALFSQITPEVTGCRSILNGAANNFQAIVLPASPRVPSGLPERLERFVADGGILILDADAMSFDNNRHRPIPTPSWFGIKVGPALDKIMTVSSKPLGLTRVAVEPRLFDRNRGVKITCTGAEPLAVFDDGSPAITVNRHGKGKVYYFGGKLPFLQLKKTLAAILNSNGIGPQTEVAPLDGAPADYVESHVIGRNGRFVWYLNNFGGGERKLKIAWPAAPDGSFTLSDIETCQVVEKNLDAAKLRKGIEVTARSQNPVTLLLELNGSGKKLKLEPLPAANRRFLAMWRPSPKSDTKILFNSCSRDEIDPFRMLTGKKMLEDSGFEIGYAKDFPKNGMVKTYFERPEIRPLTDFAVYVLPGSRGVSKENAAGIAEYVRNGGSVLISATANFGYFGWMSNWKRRDLLAAFDVKWTDNNFKDEQASTFSPYFCKLSNITAGHPVTAGVGSIQLAGAAEIQPSAPYQQVLIRSNASGKPANAPFLAAYEFGKGRVVVMGDAQWLEPEWLCQADNAQLMLNIFNWLAHREANIIPREKLKAMADSTIAEF